jgi:hypothetical protein
VQCKYLGKEAFKFGDKCKMPKKNKKKQMAYTKGTGFAGGGATSAAAKCPPISEV